MLRTWVIEKATAYSLAWRLRHEEWPCLHNIVLGLSVATHETLCGDAWRDAQGRPTQNWGASTLRELNQAECDAIAVAGAKLLASAGIPVRGRLCFEHEHGQHFTLRSFDDDEVLTISSQELAALTPLTPSVGKGHEARARAAQQAIVDAGLPIPAGEIHCDSAPGLGPYFVWFATFAEAWEGADYFQNILVGVNGTKPARAVLDDPKGTEEQLAATMYSQAYYTGFFEPTKIYEVDGKSITRKQRNIDAYASM